MKKAESVGTPMELLDRAKGCIEVQLRQLAAFLQGRMSHLSLAWQKRVLLLYCLAAAGISISVSYCSFSENIKGGKVMAPITTLPLSAPGSKGPAITIEEYQRIHGLRLRLDSLRGITSNDSFSPPAAGNWTLYDTLRYLEQVYQKQIK